MSAEELRLDLEELRRLEGLATRPRVLSLLANEIRTVDAKVPSFSLFLTPRSRAFRRSIPFGAPGGLRFVFKC
jgi:calcyclin binding protein